MQGLGSHLGVHVGREVVGEQEPVVAALRDLVHAGHQVLEVLHLAEDAVADHLEGRHPSRVVVLRASQTSMMSHWHGATYCSHSEGPGFQGRQGCSSVLFSDRPAVQAIGRIDRGADQNEGLNGTLGCSIRAVGPAESVQTEPGATFGRTQCFAKSPFTCQFDQPSDQLCQLLDRLSDHFAKHWPHP